VALPGYPGSRYVIVPELGQARIAADLVAFTGLYET
jgi:hypothetical protein